MKISVCIATCNGEKYIKEQLNSILAQLNDEDEIIISDDSSVDMTLDIISSFHDIRIKVFPRQKFHSPVWNFENALKYAKGDYIFLSDQDDVWEENKVQKTIEHLAKYSLVVSNCSIIDKKGELIKKAYFDNAKKRVGVVRNLISNNYLGCCMAFKREVLDFALPFPPKIAMHDIWIGLCADAFFSTYFIPDNLVRYRRHGSNASPTGEKSQLSIEYRIRYRLYFLYQLLLKYMNILMKKK